MVPVNSKNQKQLLPQSLKCTACTVQLGQTIPVAQPFKVSTVALQPSHTHLLSDLPPRHIKSIYIITALLYMAQNTTEYSYTHHGVVEQYIYHSQQLAHMTEVTPIIFSNADPVA
jgi:hypothetical protein